MKNIPVMILMLLCVSAMLFATETSEKKHEIIFTGRAKNGDKFEFGIISARKISYIMKIPGVEKPAVRSESVEVTAKGALTFKKVNESGNPLSLELNVDVLYGTVNGKPINCNELTGKTVVAELSGLTPEFKLKAEVSHDVNADILGSENSKQSIAELSKDATLLLGIIFQPASNETLADTLGEKALLAPGDRWDINTQKFRNTLETRKININETALNAKAMLIGRTTFQEQETWKINLMIQTKNIPGYDFIFEADIQIPTDSNRGGAFRIQRKATEIIDKRLPDSNPLSAGNTFEIISSDNTDIVMLPASAHTPKKEKQSWWQQIFQ